MFNLSIKYDAIRSSTLVRSLFSDALKSAHSPVSLALLELLKNGKDKDISEFELSEIQSYTSYVDFGTDYAFVSFLRKWKGLKTGVDTTEVAFSAFNKAEILCQQTNERLSSGKTSYLDPVIHRAIRLISSVLGPCNKSAVSKYEDWGPGATFDHKRSSAYPDTKITVLPITVTRNSLRLLKTAIESDLHWSYSILGSFPVGPYSLLESNFAIIRGGRLVTVAKNAKTDRTILVEPTGNSFLQKGVGGYIRSRLKRFGIDLNDQSINQRLAGMAQKEGLATIDLSMASDTMSYALVRELLPFEWFNYLDCLRSPEFYMNAEWRSFEKFSSMGNGFTFELESLIFWALTKASQSDSSITSVYGDDIICAQEESTYVINVLNWAGFSVNTEKSFTSGRFFESCGRHFYDGHDVTPMYQKEVVVDIFEHIRMLNRVARFLIRTVEDDNFIGPWVTPWKRRIDSLSRANGTPLLPLGSEGDDGFLVTAEFFTPKRYDRNIGYKWRIAISHVHRLPGLEHAMLALSLRRGIVVELPSYGDYASRSSNERLLYPSSRWREPTWEYYLD